MSILGYLEIELLFCFAVTISSGGQNLTSVNKIEKLLPGDPCTLCRRVVSIFGAVVKSFAHGTIYQAIIKKFLLFDC